MTQGRTRVGTGKAEVFWLNLLLSVLHPPYSSQEDSVKSEVGLCRGHTVGLDSSSSPSSQPPGLHQ